MKVFFFFFHNDKRSGINGSLILRSTSLELKELSKQVFKTDEMGLWQKKYLSKRVDLKRRI